MMEQPITAQQGVDPRHSTVARAAAVLQALAAGTYDGLPLTTIVVRTGMSKGTVHRLLAELCRVGFAFQDMRTRRYRLGTVTRELAHQGQLHEVVAHSRPILQQISAACHDTAFCSVPEGTEGVCIDRALGEYPIRTLTLNVGDRRPLGVGAGSLALLAGLDDDAVEFALHRNKSRLADYPSFNAPTLRQLVSETRARGYSLNDGWIVPEMCAIGVAIAGENERLPVAALSIAAIKSRMSPSRVEELVGLLQDRAQELKAVLTPKS